MILIFCLFLLYHAISAQQLQFSILNIARQNTLDAHNKYRYIHRVGNLQLNNNLNNIAQAYALKLASTNTFEHSNDNDYGENLYYSCVYPSVNSTYVGVSATNDWYSEISSYDFANPSFSSETGHFTQLIWKSTTNIGVGIAMGSRKFGPFKLQCAYVVCNYDPPGNYDSSEYFIDNVLLARNMG